MILHAFSSKAPQLGDVVVCFSNTGAPNANAVLALIEEVGDESIIVGPFGPLAGENEDEGSSLSSIPISEAEQRLSYPEIEVGDTLLHRGRPACVRETQQYDWHLKIEYTDSRGGEFYGNVIWMNLQPTLETLTHS